MTTKKIQHTGIMNKMRDKMPLIIIILIIAFLATIVFEWGMNYMGLGGQVDAFAKINSDEISYQDFEKIVQQQVEQMRQQNDGKDVDEAQIKQVREQVWNSLVNQTLTKQAIEKYGIKVTDKEILEWIYERPESLPDPIKKNFMDSTGVFNASFYQQALGMKTKEATEFWKQVENYLRETLLSERLQAIITEGALVTEAEVLEKYKNDSIRANFNFALLELTTVTDSSQYTVSEEDLKNYYDKHKNEFKQEANIKLKYLIFPHMPNAEDSAITMKQMENFQKQMKTASMEDSTLEKLIVANSNVSWNDDFQKSSNFEPPVQLFLFKAKPGDISDIIIGQDGFQVLKLLEIKESTELYSNASHILIKIEGTDTAAAKKEADELYNRALRGEDINELALQFSDDPSVKDNRGNLGWFTKGAMVKEFEDAVNSGKIGDVVGPVKSRYGYHIIKVGGKEKKEFKVAQMMKQVQPSNRTIQLIKKNAEDIYSQLEQGQNIDTIAKNNNLKVEITGEITKDVTIPGAPDSKKLYKFFEQSKLNTISEPVKIQSGVGIYQLIEKTPEGFRNFDSVKTTIIKPKVIEEKKFLVLSGIANDLTGKIKNGDIYSLQPEAPRYIYQTADSFSVTKPGQIIGPDFAVSETVFKLKPGEISKPVRGAKGYYIIKLNSVTEFNEQDYIVKSEEIRKSLLSSKRQQIVSDWLTKMQTDAEIIDNRDKYFE